MLFACNLWGKTTVKEQAGVLPCVLVFFFGTHVCQRFIWVVYRQIAAIEPRMAGMIYTFPTLNG